MAEIIKLQPKTQPCPLCKKRLPADYQDHGNGVTSWGVGWHECIDYEYMKRREKVKLVEGESNEQSI